VAFRDLAGSNGREPLDGIWIPLQHPDDQRAPNIALGIALRRFHVSASGSRYSTAWVRSLILPSRSWASAPTPPRDFTENVAGQFAIWICYFRGLVFMLCFSPPNRPQRLALRLRLERPKIALVADDFCVGSPARTADLR